MLKILEKIVIILDALLTILCALNAGLALSNEKYISTIVWLIGATLFIGCFYLNTKSDNN